MLQVVPFYAPGVQFLLWWWETAIRTAQGGDKYISLGECGNVRYVGGKGFYEVVYVRA